MSILKKDALGGKGRRRKSFLQGLKPHAFSMNYAGAPFAAQGKEAPAS